MANTQSRTSDRSRFLVRRYVQNRKHIDSCTERTHKAEVLDAEVVDAEVVDTAVVDDEDDDDSGGCNDR